MGRGARGHFEREQAHLLAAEGLRGALHTIERRGDLGNHEIHQEDGVECDITEEELPPNKERADAGVGANGVAAPGPVYNDRHQRCALSA